MPVFSIGAIKRDTEEAFWKLSRADRKALGQSIVQSFLTFQQSHPQLAKQYEKCVGRTRQVLRALHLD